MGWSRGSRAWSFYGTGFGMATFDSCTFFRLHPRGFCGDSTSHKGKSKWEDSLTNGSVLDAGIAPFPLLRISDLELVYEFNLAIKVAL